MVIIDAMEKIFDQIPLIFSRRTFVYKSDTFLFVKTRTVCSSPIASTLCMAW